MRDAERIAEILGDWYERRAEGEILAPEVVIARHPDLAELLRARFAALGLLSQVLVAPPELPEGTPAVIGDFRILREIGRGGMGAVYEVEQVSMERRVALKVLSPAITGTAQAVKRFQREAKAAGKLHHTNIVPIYAMGQHAGYWYYAMELVEGRTLSNVIAELRAVDRGPTEASLARVAGDAAADPTPGTGTSTRAYYVRVAEMFAGVAEALHLAHHEGVIHRDIKPSNLLLDSDGTLKIVDFGLALTTDEGGPAITLTGDLLGTPVYMSPEQAMAKRIAIDHRTDVYSLGATLYELLSLRPPFAGKNLHEICSQIITKDPLLPRRANRQVPRDLETIVLKAMEKDRDRRYQSAGELARDLQRFAEGAAIRAHRIGLAGRGWRRIKRHKVRSVLAAVAVLLAATAGTLWWRSAREARLLREVKYERFVLGAEAALGRRLLVDRAEEGSDAAGKLLDEAIRLMPNRREAYWLRVLDPTRPAARRNADLETATRHGFPRGAYHSARAIWLLQSEPKEAEREWKLAEAHKGSDAVDSFFEARLRLAAGEWDAAVAAYSRALADSPEESLIHRLALVARGALRFRTGDFDKALADLLKLPSQPEVRIWIAAAWRQMGKREIAEEEFARALCMPENAAAWYALCSACAAVTKLGPITAGPGQVAVDDAAWYERATAAAIDAFPADHDLLCYRGDALLRSCRFAEALAIAERAVEVDPTRHRAHRLLGRAHMYLGQYDAALGEFNKAIEVDPGCSCGYYSKAQVLLQMNRNAKALEILEQGLKQRGRRAGLGRADLHRARGEVLQAMGKFDDALAAWDEALRVDPGDTQALRSRYVLRTKARQFDGALEDLERLLKRAHRREVIAEIRGSRAAVLRSMGKDDEAREETNAAVALLNAGVAEKPQESIRARDPDPVAAEILYRCGVVSGDLGHFEDAEMWYRRALEADARHVASHLNLASVLGREGPRLQQAAQECLAVLQIDDSVTLAHALLACIWGRLGQYEESLKAASAALAVDTELARRQAQVHRYKDCNMRHMADSARGTSRTRLRRWEKAAEDFEQCATIHKDVFAWVNRAAALNNLGRYAEALKSLERAERGGVEHPHLHYVRGYALARLGEIPRAFAALDKAPGYPPAAYEKAWIQANASRPEYRDVGQALETARRLVRQDEENGHSWFLLGVACYRGGLFDESREALQRSLRCDEGAQDHLFLAMVEKALGHDREALKSYERAVELMDQRRPNNATLIRRAEAEEVLGISDGK